MRSYMVALGLLFIALCHPSYAQTESTAAAASPDPIVVEYNINWLKPFTLNCTPALEADLAAVTFTWFKNDTSVEKVPELKDRYSLEQGGMQLQITARSTEDDYGNYSCFANDAPAQRFSVRARPYVRLPANTNVVEGQKLKLSCKVLGKPYPTVQWLYAAEAGQNGTDVAEALAGRAQVSASAAGVPGADLVLEAARRDDAGVYTCVAAPGDHGAAATTLRVKDMYAALWPFLGICAEVFVLCAIILVYEKRRTKPELDDSDTDNHDQKES